MQENVIDKQIEIWFRRHLKAQPMTHWEYEPETRLVAEYVDDDEIDIIKYAIRKVTKYGVKVHKVGQDRVEFEFLDVNFDDDYLIIPERKAR